MRWARMIVAGPEGFIKNQYRKFNMKTDEFQGDDFAMMKAMIRRRFARMLHGARVKSA